MQEGLQAKLFKSYLRGNEIPMEVFSDEYKKLAQAAEKLRSNTKGVVNPVIDPDVLLQYYINSNATTTARASVFAAIIDKVRASEDVNENHLQLLIDQMVLQERARQLGNLAIDIMNGSTTVGWEDIKEFVNKVEVKNEGDYGMVENNVTALINSTSTNNYMGFELSSLQEATGGAGRGHIVQVFARPETGKTTFVAHCAVGYLKQGFKVAYFANEEPGRSVLMTIMRSYFNKTQQEIVRDIKDIEEEWYTFSKDLALYHCTDYDIRDIKKCIDKTRPDIVIIDQLDNVAYRGNVDNNIDRIGKLYREARSIASMYECLVIEVGQASADAEGKQLLTMDMMANSKTDKPATADLVIGIGKRNSGDDDEIRCLSICKNKINGNHSPIYCKIDAARGRYNV